MLEVVLAVVLMVVTIVVRALVCAAAAIDTFVEVLTVNTRIDVMFIVSGVAVDFLMDAVTGGAMGGVLTNIDVVKVLADVNINVFAGVMIAVMPCPFE